MVEDLVHLHLSPYEITVTCPLIHKVPPKPTLQQTFHHCPIVPQRYIGL